VPAGLNENLIMFKMLQMAMLLLASYSSIAQFSLKGSVIDSKTKAGLSGATLKVADRIFVTDMQGFFEVPSLPQGEYEIEIKFLGYATRLMGISLYQDELIQISLDETFTLTDEVVIYATRANDKTPSTYTNLNKQILQKQNFGQDLPFLLNWIPSVVTTSDAGAGVGYTGIRIRGSDATRINVTINGIPYNDSESLGTFWVDVPDIASSSQSVQVQRGVGTSTNGAGAFGASINLQTNTLNREAYGEVINSFGSFNTRRHTLSVGTGLLHDHWMLDGRISKIVSDGFIDRASSDLESYYFSGGFYADKTIIKAILFGGSERTYQSWYGVPESRLNNDIEAMEITAMNEGWNEEQTNLLLNSNSRTFNIYTYKNQVDDYRQDHYQLHFSHRTSNSLTANASLHYTRGRGFYEEYRYDDDFANYGLSDVIIGDSVITASDMIRRRWLDNDFYGITYSLNYENEKSNVVLGGAWNRYEGDHFGELMWAEVTTVPIEYQYYFNKGDKRDFNIFLKTNYQLTSKLNAFVDLQYRRITYQASGKENKQNDFDIDVEYNFFNPKIGLTYQLNEGQQVYTSFSVANREPVRDDFVDNPESSPKHEELYNLEAGYRKTINHFTLQTNYYLMQYKNQLVLTGKLNDVGAPVRTNVDNSYRMGIEAEATWKISTKLNWIANATLSRNKIKEFIEVLYDYGVNFDEYNVIERNYTHTDISFSPNVIVGSGFSYFPVLNAEITLLTKFVGRQYLDNTSTEARSMDPYVTNDVRLRYTVSPKFMKEISMSFLINNVLDEKYESNGYTYGYLGGGDEYRENFYYPQAGRNFMAMLIFKF
jgi:iron complex outermembrane receptor protein